MRAQGALAMQLGNVFESQILLGGIRTQRSAANTMVSSPNRLVASAQVAPNLATSKDRGRATLVCRTYQASAAPAERSEVGARAKRGR